MERRRKWIAAGLAVLNGILLFCPWGSAEAGGELWLGSTYSNPIMVKGSYPLGTAAALKKFSDELDGFQEQSELLWLVLMMILIFLAAMELGYIGSRILGLQCAHALGIVTEGLVILVALAGITAGIVWRNGWIQVTEGFRIVTSVRLNPVPFLIIISEVIGKNVCLMHGEK